MSESTHIRRIWRRTWHLAATALVCTLVFLPGARGEELATNAAVEISIPLEVKEMEPVDFGRVVRPSAGSNTFTLDWNSGAVSVTGGGDGSYIDGANRGRYRVRGPSGDTIVVTATIGSFGVAGISVDETHLEGTTSSKTVNLNPSGMYFAQVGGVITIDDSAPTGVHTADVYITANYP